MENACSSETQITMRRMAHTGDSCDQIDFTRPWIEATNTETRGKLGDKLIHLFISLQRFHKILTKRLCFFLFSIGLV